MYKYVSIFLLVVVGVLGFVLLVQDCNHKKERKDLNNELAKVQEIQKETETAYSRLAIETENLRASKKDLQEVIENRNERILALSQTNIKLKDKIVRIENASQFSVDADGNVVVPDSNESSPDVLDKSRTKVVFEKEETPIKVSGFTITNPPEAEVKIEWTKPLELEIILVKNPDGTFRIYLDSKSSEVVQTNLKLKVDPTVLEYEWYQKISFGSTAVFGETGVLFGINANYDILNNLSLGPQVQLGYLGNNKAEVFFGANVLWYPWR